MPLRDYILNHLGWKIGSVISAVLIWFAIYFPNKDSFQSSASRILFSSTMSRALPVTVITTATDLRGFTITPKEVEVTVRGDSGVLNKLKLSDVQAFVNLTDVKDETNFQKRVIVHTPTNLIPIRVVPEEVTVQRVSPPEPLNNHRTQQ